MDDIEIQLVLAKFRQEHVERSCASREIEYIMDFSIFNQQR